MTTHEGDGVKTTVLAFSGVHTGMGGRQSDEAQVGLLAYVEIEGGPITLKLVGPPEQMSKAVIREFDGWVKSFRAE